MSFDPGILIPIIALSIPIVAIWTKHERRMAEIKATQGATVSADVLAELTALKNEMTALRETSTSFDMSFDAALSSLEKRMDRVETQPRNETIARAPLSPVLPQEIPPQTVTLGVGQGS